MLNRIIVVCCFFAGSFLSAMGQNEENINVRQTLLSANRALKGGSYYLAIDRYQKVLDVDSAHAEALAKIAKAYRLSRDYNNAASFYRKVRNQLPGQQLSAIFYDALMTKMNGEYNKAAVLFKKVLQRDSIFRANGLGHFVDFASIEKKGCAFAKRQSKRFPYRIIDHLPDHVNSPYSELSPYNLKGDTLIYASLPIDTAIVIKGDQELKDADHIKFYYTIEQDGGYTKRKRFKTFDEYKRHVANGSYDSVNKRFYYTICRQDKYNKIPCDLYVRDEEPNGWSEAQKLPAPINKDEFSSTHPSVGVLGGEPVLFFASNREGSLGGKDLWYITIEGDDEYGEPVRLSDSINTKRDEVSPFFSYRTGDLYFSSNGHVGMGGYDVYRTKYDTGMWMPPENIGPPVNSSVDEMYFSYNAKDEGYFVSNRKGSIAFKHPTCCDDIYRFSWLDAPILAGLVFTGCQGDEPKEKLKGATIKLYEGQQKDQEQLVYADTLTESSTFNYPLKKERHYILQVAKPRYFNRSIEFNTMNPASGDTLFKTVCLKKMLLKAYRLKNIYYDFDKWFLRDTSQKTLDSLYTIMQENPDIIVEIGSHTDSRGTNYYNMWLSRKRAESCVKYLIYDKDVDSRRLQAAGYGENKKLENCLQYEECPPDDRSDCPCHQMNRRTEFRIIGSLDGELTYDSPRYGDEKQGKDVKP